VTLESRQLLEDRRIEQAPPAPTRKGDSTALAGVVSMGVGADLSEVETPFEIGARVRRIFR